MQIENREIEMGKIKEVHKGLVQAEIIFFFHTIPFNIIPAEQHFIHQKSTNGRAMEIAELN